MPLETETRNIETETKTKTETIKNWSRDVETETGLETLTSLTNTVVPHRVGICDCYNYVYLNYSVTLV